MKTNIVKSAVTAIAAALVCLVATPQAEARTRVHVHVGSGYHHAPVYHTQRYLIGYDHYGRPVWGYRQVLKCRPVVRPCPPPPVCRPVYRPVCRPRPVQYCR